MKVISWLLGTMSLIMLLGSSVYASPKDLDISLSLTDNNALSITETEDVMVRFTLTNHGKKSLKVLKWALPFSNVDEKLFDVTLDGEQVEFLGRVYKRGEASSADYITVGADETIARDVAITKLYDFTKSGLYTIQYRTGHFNLFQKKDKTKGKYDVLSTEAFEIWIDGRAKPVVEEGTVEVWDGIVTNYATPQYTGSCTSSEKSTIVSALSSAQSIATTAWNYLYPYPSSTPPASTIQRYITWFGTYNSSRWISVEDNFWEIYLAIKYETITFDCSCNQNYYAYVYPSQPYKVYLCNAFWSASRTGTDSQSGTIVHEISHFNVVAGTDDYVYGQTGAKNLAISNPSQAIENADNHEYFAENTPYLP